MRELARVSCTALNKTMTCDGECDRCPIPTQNSKSQETKMEEQ
jgi:hypothetical protein